MEGAERFKRLGFQAVAAILLLNLAACGWAEWPPPGRRVATAAPPPQTAAPVAAPAAAEVAAPAEAVVRPGETVYAVASRHDVSVRGLIEANALQVPYKLTAGQKLRLPNETRHVVVKGDTLSAIARQYNADQGDLVRMNALEPPYTIQIGRKLRIPRPEATAAEAAAPPPPAATTAAAIQVEALPSPGAPSASLQPLPPPQPRGVPDAPLAEAPSRAVAADTSEPATAMVPAAPAVTVPAKTGEGFAWPLRGQVVSSFGAKDKGLFNDGINIAAPQGTPVAAAGAGVVVYAGNELRGFGNLVLVKHDGGWVTAYAHNDRLLVKRGDRVEKGQRIAHVGSTGSVRSPQLHFEIRRGKTPVDPQRYLAGNEA